MIFKIINFVLFQAAWFVCVLGASYDRTYFALLIASIILLFHFAILLYFLLLAGAQSASQLFWRRADWGVFREKGAVIEELANSRSHVSLACWGGVSFHLQSLVGRVIVAR